MNGQLSEHPLAELIREISAKSLSGRLQLQHDRLKVAVYFDCGKLLYAVSNVRTFRLREYLLKAALLSDEQLARYDDRLSDLELARNLSAQQLLSPSAAEQIQSKQVSDVLRVALLWTEGAWEFDHRSHLTEAPHLKVDARLLLLDAARRLPPKFAVSRFRNPAELISPVGAPLVSDSLRPPEVFLLSRLERPTALHQLVAVSGLSEAETLSLAYSLALGGFLQREHWSSAFRSQAAAAEAPKESAPQPPEAIIAPEEDIESFLQRLTVAQSHYEVLGVGKEASPAYLKTKYYELARRYHPDRFRKAESSLLTRIESAFARITQAYETLRDERLRANYDAKLQAREKAQQLADAAPKATAPTPPPAGVEAASEPAISIAERAEAQFKEGLAALELGQRRVAAGLFAAAARAVPNEPRYRAFYGQMLATDETMRRAAEAELQAAVKLAPENSEYRAILAELYRDLGLMLRARGEAERALAIDPNNRKARDLLRTLKAV